MNNSKERLKKLIDESYEVDIKLGKSLFGKLNSDEIVEHLLESGVYAFPCNINDEVWENIYNSEGIFKYANKAIVVGYHVEGLSGNSYLVLYSPTMDQKYHREFSLIGDTIFFSREDAETHRERKRK